MKGTTLLVSVLGSILGLAAGASAQLPAGWESADVGEPNLPGSSAYDGRGRVFTINGNGSGIGDTWDQFYYVYQHRSGDFMITAKLRSMDQPDASAKAGVMIRETLEGHSRYAMVVLMPGNGVAFQRRVETGGAWFNTAGPAATPPHWVRLVRQANTLTGYASEDGVDWTPVGAESIAMGPEVLFGLAVTSHNPGALCTAEFGPVSVELAPHSLVAHWTFDEGRGLIAHDASGNSLDGALVGDPQWTKGAPCIGLALDFDGHGDYVDCGNNSLFNLTDQITVAAWVKIRTVRGNWTSVVNKGLTAWRLETLYDTRRMHFAVTDEHYIDADANIPPNEWHHVCGTYDGSNIRLYMNGVQDAASPAAYSGPIATNTNNLLIGRYSGGLSSGEWDGLIDDVRIYNYPLDADEILKRISVEPPRGDLNNDCAVDSADLAVLAASWLIDCELDPTNPACVPKQPISKPGFKQHRTLGRQ
ncbi:MAG: hypothetical protein JSU70_16825 [Phycisphaerales bacterium]|nr:MAG: hypothetical protein JSU70_16825 [Phycisphaerales bacterium]